MARKARIWRPNTSYHVTARGNRQGKIFNYKDDYNTYLKILEKTLDEFKEDSPFELISYCLMNNHVHLLMHTSSKPLGVFFHKFHTRYAVFFNAKYGYRGHLFEDRFHSGSSLGPSEILSVSRYIHLNPVEAGLVTRPEHYLYSSYRSSVGLTDSKITNDKRMLDLFNSPQPHASYRKYVEAKLKV